MTRLAPALGPSRSLGTSEGPPLGAQSGVPSPHTAPRSENWRKSLKGSYPAVLTAIYTHPAADTEDC